MELTALRIVGVFEMHIEVDGLAAHAEAEHVSGRGGKGVVVNGVAADPN